MEPDKVVIIVRNSKGEFFIHQRSADKESFPSLYGLGAGGKVDLNETPHQAAVRELKEELDIISHLKELFSIRYRMGEVSYIVHAFHTLFDGKPKACKEFQWSGWAGADKIEMLIEEEKLCPDTKAIYRTYKKDYMHIKKEHGDRK